VAKTLRAKLVKSTLLCRRIIQIVAAQIVQQLIPIHPNLKPVQAKALNQMNHPNQNNKILSIGKLRKLLTNTVGQDLIDEGFTINKTFTVLKKRVEIKNKITCFFDCYDYLPERLEYRLLFEFKIFELVKEAERFYKYCGIEFNGFPLVLGEGSFHPRTKELDLKFRSAFTHVVTDFEMFSETVEDCKMVLHNEIIPRLPTFSTLHKFQEFVLQDYNSVYKLGIGIFSIIAAKLKGKEELHKLVAYLWEKLKIDSLNGQHLLRKLYGNILTYAEKYPESA
jgi:hypothetical protein